MVTEPEVRPASRRWRAAALLVGSAVAAAAVSWLVGLSLPAESMLPRGVPVALVAAGCHGAPSHVAAARDPVLSERLVVVVIPESGAGTDLVALDCELLATRVRAEHPAMRLVPRGAICRRLQRWGRSEVETAGRILGQVTWLVEGEVVAKADEYAVLTGHGIAYQPLSDGGFRLEASP